MHRLVALDLPGGPAFVEAVQRCWEADDAVAVLPRRLSPTAKAALRDRLRPHAVIMSPDLTEVPGDSAAPPLEEGDRLVVATSGSTGHPRLLVHTEAGLLVHALAVHERLDVDPATDRWLGCLPLDHLGGFGVVARSLLTGVAIDVTDGFDPGVVAAAPTDLGSTLVSLVASALDRVDAAAFRWVVLGGGADGRTRPANVVRTYGLTESGGGVVYDGIALAGVEVRIDDRGRVGLRSPTIARGERQTDGSVVPIVDTEGWLTTGDLGAIEDGRLVVHGRADDLIITGGENVWPEPVADALRTHPSVADAAVVAAPSPEWGQEVVALVVPADPSAPPTLEPLRSHVKDHLAPAAAPRRLVLVERVPRTALGKLDRETAHRLVRTAD